jgi:NADH-quinone oxidoreductase subunit E
MEKYTIQVCRGTACHVRKSAKVLQAIFDATGTSPEQLTSDDGMFRIEIVSCLEMCASAPVITVNGTAHGNLTPETAAALIDELREKA